MDLWLEWIPGNLGVMAFASVPTAVLWNLKVLHKRDLGDKWKRKVALIVVVVAAMSPLVTTLVRYVIDLIQSSYDVRVAQGFEFFWGGGPMESIRYHNASLVEVPGTEFALVVLGYTVVMFALMFAWSQRK
jgi:hypothetical protein